jgi:hypothetical protein
VAPNPRSSGSAPRSARDAALALAARRDYTAAELVSRLKDQGHDPGDITHVLDDLRDRGVINDRRVAAAHVRTAAAVKGRGQCLARGPHAASLAIVDEALGGISPRRTGAIGAYRARAAAWPSLGTARVQTCSAVGSHRSSAGRLGAGRARKMNLKRIRT